MKLLTHRVGLIAKGLALAIGLGTSIAGRAAEPTPADSAVATANTPVADYSKPLLLRSRAQTEVMLSSPAGYPHRIMISAPQGAEPKDGYPVFYILDGDAWFATAVEIVKMREYEKLDPAIVVGIGYPSRSFFDAFGRSYDFTPPASSDPDMEGIPLGGADDFLAFLNGTVKPWVQTRHRANSSRQILFGHSLGGLFALYALYKAPESFAVYLAASPDLPFSDHIIKKYEPAFAANPARRSPRLLVTDGGLESHPSPELTDDYRRFYAAHPETHPGQTADQAVQELFAMGKAGYDKIADTRSLVARLAHHGVHANFVDFPGEEHMSSAVNALNRGIPFALRPAR
ncbi:MAG: alpha/beta hydrolase [Alphaproteobacteria bacterium]|nr:alpha/beta hydrolase [Alphaproteobacteria bacterium]